MPREIYAFEVPERFIAGTVGSPGERIFYLQAVKGSRIISVILEKNQVALLCERLDALLDQVIDSDLTARELIPKKFREETLDLEPLATPVAAEFRVGTIAIGFNNAKALITIEAHQDTAGLDVPDIESTSEEGPNLLRVRVTPEVARNFAERGRRLVAAGRPPCPFCQLPLEPQGHICPRANGYRR